jgi:DNA-binding IclR family transcriptional regulator
MMTDDQIGILFKRFYYVPSAPNPIKNTKDLWQEIELARKLGHSTSFGERVAGSASVAVPVAGYICPAILNILGPAVRFTNDKICDILAQMKSSAARISKELNRLSFELVRMASNARPSDTF